MNMRRDPEFLWESTRPRSKFRARLLLVGAGVATGYMVVQSGRYPAPEQQLPSLAGEDKAVGSGRKCHEVRPTLNISVLQK